jgi:DNA-binding response OmpR family regulator
VSEISPSLSRASCDSSSARSAASSAIVAITAYSLEDNLQRLTDAGFDAALPKPSKHDSLMATLTAVLERHKGEHVLPPHGPYTLFGEHADQYREREEIPRTVPSNADSRRGKSRHRASFI